MDFNLTDEQGMLVRSVQSVFAKLEPEARTRDTWATYVAMGWLGLLTSEKCGGLGGSFVDVAVLVEELGRELASSEYILAAYLPMRLVETSDGAWSEQLLPACAIGSERLAAALLEPGGRDLRYPPSAIVRREGKRFVLSGSKTLVFGADQADRLIVSVAYEGRPALIVVPRALPGLMLHDRRLLDGSLAADLEFRSCVIPDDCWLSRDDAAVTAIDASLDEAVVLLCAEAVGSVAAVIAMTVEHLKARVQFRQPLASFQALQHGIADMFIEANDAKSILLRAASFAHASPEARAAAASACRVKVLRATRKIVGQAVHYHGGMGMTCEHRVGSHLRRLLAVEQLFGGELAQLSRYRRTMNSHELASATRSPELLMSAI